MTKSPDVLKLEERICGMCGSLDSDHDRTNTCLRWGGIQRTSPPPSDWRFSPWGKKTRSGDAWDAAWSNAVARLGIFGPPAVPATRAVCCCNIKDLLSDTGHAKACPERKVR